MGVCDHRRVGGWGVGGWGAGDWGLAVGVCGGWGLWRLGFGDWGGGRLFPRAVRGQPAAGRLHLQKVRTPVGPREVDAVEEERRRT